MCTRLFFLIITPIWGKPETETRQDLQEIFEQPGMSEGIRLAWRGSVPGQDPFKLGWFHDWRLLFWPVEEIAVAGHDQVGLVLSGEVDDEVVIRITRE